LFVSHAAQVDTFTPGETVRSGPIISLGVARRDYPTLFEALRQLEGFETEIYCQSRYGDPFAKDRLGALPPCVRFVDTVPDDALPTVYREARFVVVPLLDSRILSAGASVVMEASAAGKAVIATRNPGMSSLIEDGVSGILVPPGDAAALRTAIRELWEDPERATQLGLAARERVVQRYRPAVVYAGIREMLDRLYRAAGSPA
jgi:glycosyltransferase involved in cell wall biosynthesis